MFPRDNEATWINRPGNGMHLGGKRLTSRLALFKTFKPFEKKKKNEGKGYRKVFEKNDHAEINDG